MIHALPADHVLKSLRFRNYRCFRDYRLPLKTETILVGRNNAGKSTAIEGFRLVSLVTERFPNFNFQAVPDWLGIGKRNRGARIDFSGLGISWDNVFHRYQDPPAIVEASFETGYVIDIYLGPEGTSHTVLKNPDGRPITTRAEAAQHNLPRVSVLPPVAALEKDEVILVPEYVRASLSSYLAPRHFRNQLKLLHSNYGPFKELVEATWPAVQVTEFRGANGRLGQKLHLLVRDGDFVAEVAAMGHGLQMWLQTIWFLCRTSRNHTVVFDEPDVYMHPDLQRKLIRHLRTLRPQVIVATHSTEILSEAEASNVLVIDRGSSHAAFSTSLPTIQKVLDNIGSAQNIHLTRLWTSRKLLLVEGKDIKFLSLFHAKLFPDSEVSLEVIPNMPIGGWNGWPYAVGSAMLLQNSGGEAITTYCVLDRDFFSEEELESRMHQASARNVQLHIWQRKEIENYLLVPDVVYRLIRLRITKGSPYPEVVDIENQFDQICNDLKHVTIDALAQNYFNVNRNLGLPSANQRARIRAENAWHDRQGRLGLVSGKEMLSRLSAWSQQYYNVSFGPLALAQQIRAFELAPEVTHVIQCIHMGRPLR